MESGNYAAGFEDFQRFSDDNLGIETWLQQNMTGIIKDTMEKTGLRGENNRPFRMLSIGCGTGEKDVLMINKALEYSTNISYTAMDPNPKHLEKCKRNIHDSMKVKVHTDVHQMSVEDYEEHFRHNPALPYHFISSIHSMYQFKDVAGTIEFLYNKCLQPGCIMVFMVESCDTGVDLWLKEFTEDLKATGGDICSAGDALDKALRQFGFPFQVQHYNTHIDVSSCFEDTEEGNKYLDFLCTTSNVRQTGAAYLDKLLQRLKTLSSVVDGKIIVNSENDVFIIRKPN